jgi:tetratricopeptide (TPR) repeat protein
MDASENVRDTSPQRLLILFILLIAGFAGGAAVYYAFEPDVPVEDMLSDDRPTMTPSQAAADRVMQLAMQGARARAVDLGRRWIEDHPDDVEVRTALARVYASSDQPKEAEELVDKALSIDPDAPRACWVKGLLHADEPTRAEAWFAKAAAQDDAGPDIWGKYGLRLMQRGDTDQAESYLRRAIAAGSEDAAVYRAAGEIAWAHGRREEALAKLQRARKLEPRDPRNHSALAEAQAMGGQYEAALDTLDGGMDAAKGPARTLLQLQRGEILEMAGEWEEAGDVYAGVADGVHMTLPGLIGAARSYHRAGLDAKAMGYIDQAYQLDPDNPEVVALRKRIKDARFVKPGGLLEFTPDIDGDGKAGDTGSAESPDDPSPFSID